MHEVQLVRQDRRSPPNIGIATASTAAVPTLGLHTDKMNESEDIVASSAPQTVDELEGNEDGTRYAAMQLETEYCYICEEDGGQPAFAVCACADRLLHLHCQQQLMKHTRAHRLGCPVCRTQYINVEQRIANRRVSYEGRRCIAYVLGVVFVHAIGVYEAVMFVLMADWYFMALAVVFALLGMCFGALAFSLFRNLQFFAFDQLVIISAPHGRSCGESLRAMPSVPEAPRATAAHAVPLRGVSAISTISRTSSVVRVQPIVEEDIVEEDLPEHEIQLDA